MKFVLPQVNDELALLGKLCVRDQRWLLIQGKTMQAQAVILVDLLQANDVGFSEAARGRQGTG